MLIKTITMLELWCMLIKTITMLEWWCMLIKTVTMLEVWVYVNYNCYNVSGVGVC
jgi:hypothetical protein